MITKHKEILGCVQFSVSYSLND